MRWKVVVENLKKLNEDEALYCICLGIEHAIVEGGEDRADFEAYLGSGDVRDLPATLQEGLLRLSYECREDYRDAWRHARDLIRDSMVSNNINVKAHLHGLLDD